MDLLKVAVLIPTYNEAENIELLLRKLRQVSSGLGDTFFLIYIIDDSSPDGTAQLAIKLNCELQTENFRVNVICRTKKEGLGKAYIDGFKRMLAMDKPPDFVLQMDADLSHDPLYVEQFINAANSNADFIVGTRYVTGGSCPNWSWNRKLLSRGGNSYARFILGRKVTDYTGGFNMYSLNILKKIDWDNLNNAGYGFLIDLKYQSQRFSKKIVEIPIKFLDRQYGVSKMPLNTIFKNFILVINIKLNNLKRS
jgi:dolichol-phosphate mannosyltransferase